MLVIAFLRDGQFHVHLADCSCREELPPDGRSHPFDAKCYEDVARHCYARFLRSGAMTIGEALDSLSFAPCTQDLTYSAIKA
jgi:hypothetical protein